MSMRRAEIVTGRIIGTDTRAVMRNAGISIRHDEGMNSVSLIQRRTTPTTHCARYQNKPTYRINLLNG